MNRSIAHQSLRWPLRMLPVIRVAGRFPMGDNSRDKVYVSPTHALHQHAYHATLRLGGQRFELQPGDVTLTPSGVESQYDLPQNGFHLCLHFDRAASGGGGIALPSHWPAGANAAFVSTRLWHIIELTRRSQQRGPTGTRARVAAGTALQALLAWLAFMVTQPAATATSSRSRGGIEHLLKILDKRFSQALSVADLAAQVGLSRNYLTGLFRRRTGVTIQQYVLHRRIELAQHLLKTTRLAIKEVGAEVGLPDPQYFNKQYRRLTGESPSATRGAAALRSVKL